ncbi:hypothetical protein FAEUMB_12580 [Faecalimonas umbilicata]|uniref:RNA-directed DNA polymerase n=1 Tax=Faecalimonas umbilicata TaxID=1912855 RepID=A0ABQ0QWG7_9FIRM|nr:hypothetical protein FAEUMB_12580 [Faecalimonas umbilicata]
MGEFNRARLLLWTYYLSVYNKVVQAILQKKKGALWRRKKIHSHIQNGCANITSFSH